MGRVRLRQPLSPDDESTSTTVKINDLMAKRVITAEPHYTVARVRGLMRRNRILAIPVVGPDCEAVGIVTATDLMDDLKDLSPINQIMTRRVYKVPAYNDVSVVHNGQITNYWTMRRQMERKGHRFMSSCEVL